MLLIETIASVAAKTIVGKLINWGYDKVTESEYSNYEQELYQVILDTVNEFQKMYPIDETEKIPFYTSQLLFDEFLKFRFTKQIDIDQLQDAFIKEKKIIPPTKEEISWFFELFDKNIRANKKIDKLNIEDNYKEEIFNISNQISELKSIVSEFKEIKEKEDSNLNEYEIQLLKELYKYQKPCQIAAANDEYECVWVPGFLMRMQWGWERYEEVQATSGKNPGSRKERLRWIIVVKELASKAYLKELPKRFYELTDNGNKVAHKLTHNEEL
jgi:hypothetical protein